MRAALTKITRRAVLKTGLAAAAGGNIGRAVSKIARLEIGGGTIDASVEGGPCDLSTTDVVQWVTEAARAVTSYFGRFPVQRARVEIRIVEGRQGVLRGTSFGEDGVLSRMAVGQHSTVYDLKDDWTMAHEMVHFGFPSVRRRHHWIEEGSATYIEPIARAQIKQLTAKQVWGDMVRDMPQGLPHPGDQGLDNTHTWASTYWGGAIFCVVADVRIRKRTGNKKGLQDAFRAINRAGGSIKVEWPLDRVLAIGDRATDGNTLAELYQQMGLEYLSIDLAALWTQLGVIWDGDRVMFDGHAPLAAVREAILV
ncbi:MAG: hypothetical protein ACR2IV_14550 [Bryobacteraceae bacterium]